jgi:hypothetical protein
MAMTAGEIAFSVRNSGIHALSWLAFRRRAVGKREAVVHPMAGVAEGQPAKSQRELPLERGED